MERSNVGHINTQRRSMAVYCAVHVDICLWTRENRDSIVRVYVNTTYLFCNDGLSGCCSRFGRALILDLAEF